MLSYGSLMAATNDGAVTLLPVDAAAGSAEPRLTEGRGGPTVLSWLEPDGDATALRFAVLGPEGWGPTRTVARGDDWFVNWADFPSVVPIDDSFWAAHWLQRRPGSFYAYDVAIALSSDAGDSWSRPLTPHRDGTLTEHGFVSLFPWRDGVGAVWLDGRKTHTEAADTTADEIAGMTLRSAVISRAGVIGSEEELDGLVCDCCQTGVALTRQGAVAVYRNRTGKEIRDIYAARWVDGRWQAGRPVADDGWMTDGCPVNGPAVAAQADEVVVAWFTMAGDTPRVRFARSADGARTFDAPLELARGSPAGRVDAVLLGDGSAAVSWLDTGSEQRGTIRVQIIAPDGTLRAQRVIAQSETTRPAGFPQLAADGDALIAAWTDVSGEDSRVRTARIDP